MQVELWLASSKFTTTYIGGAPVMEGKNNRTRLPLITDGNGSNNILDGNNAPVLGSWLARTAARTTTELWADINSQSATWSGHRIVIP